MARSGNSHLCPLTSPRYSAPHSLQETRMLGAHGHVVKKKSRLRLMSNFHLHRLGHWIAFTESETKVIWTHFNLADGTGWIHTATGTTCTADRTGAVTWVHFRPDCSNLRSRAKRWRRSQPRFGNRHEKYARASHSLRFPLTTSRSMPYRQKVHLHSS